MQRFLWMFLNLFLRLWDKLDRRLCHSLPYPTRLWWHRLWIRKNEFHPSLDSDADYVVCLEHEQRHLYWGDLARRRGIAHQRDLGEAT